MSEFDANVGESRNGYEGRCQACDRFGPVDDLSLCQECAVKLERDLIRQRDWDYSAAAFGLPDEGREELHRRVIAQYGQALAIIAHSGVSLCGTDKPQNVSRPDWEC